MAGNPLRFHRYVALGDSSTEGIDDPDGRGGYRGWADRLAAKVARSNPALLYANLAVRGRKSSEILATQLQPALAMRPDLVTLFSGTNDVVGRRFDALEVASVIETMQRAFRANGATLLTFTLPDLGPVLPAARRLSPRIAALNDVLRRVSQETGAVLVDFALHPITVDPRLWSDDRFHANGAGHARIAAALAAALGLPGSDDAWQEPLPPVSSPGRWRRLRSDLRWARRHLAPWLLRRLAGRSSGDARGPKRPRLEPAPAAEP